MRTVVAPWLRVAAALLVSGWGANQFAPMMLVYPAERGWSRPLVTFAFSGYVLGLMPSLLAAAWLSQHLGRRPLVRAAMVLMLLGGALQLAGADVPGLVIAGRLVIGVGLGCVMGPGTAWLVDLVTGAPRGTVARRAAWSLTGGFMAGGLVAGLTAQWLPAPLHTPYVLHLVAQAVVTVGVWNVPETQLADRPTPTVAAVARHLWSGWFLRVVLPAAPWVFGCAGVAFGVIPSFTGHLPGVPAVAAAGLTAGLTLGTSLVVQPLARRHAHQPSRVAALGLTCTAVGMALAWASAWWPHWGWLVPGALVLGAGHGLTFVSCLTSVELNTPPHLMSPSTAVVYCLCYVGFTAPFVLAVLALVAPVWVGLAIGTVLAALTAVWLAVQPATPAASA